MVIFINKQNDSGNDIQAWYDESPTSSLVKDVIESKVFSVLTRYIHRKLSSEHRSNSLSCHMSTTTIEEINILELQSKLDIEKSVDSNEIYPTLPIERKSFVARHSKLIISY